MSHNSNKNHSELEIKFHLKETAIMFLIGSLCGACGAISIHLHLDTQEVPDSPPVEKKLDREK